MFPTNRINKPPVFGLILSYRTLKSNKTRALTTGLLEVGTRRYCGQKLEDQIKASYLIGAESDTGPYILIRVYPDSRGPWLRNREHLMKGYFSFYTGHLV